MAEESFPNAENAFIEAFTQSDPVPKLLDLIKAHPRLETIADLVFVYNDLAAKHPTEIEKFAEALVKIQNSEGLTVATADNVGKAAQVDIGTVLDRQLAELHGNDLVIVEDPSVTPSNNYLIASLLSAISMKYRLTDSPAQAGAIAHGLRYKDERYKDPQESLEIIVLGACLQLLVSGAYLYGPEGTEVKKGDKIDVLAALEAVKADNVVKNSNGVKLLDATIEHAKSSKFEKDLDIKGAWSILFP